MIIAMLKGIAIGVVIVLFIWWLSYDIDVDGDYGP